MAQIKTINRNIVKSDKCRCKYDKPITFEILQVNIIRNEREPTPTSSASVSGSLFLCL